MDRRAKLEGIWVPVREFLTYSGKVQSRAINDTIERTSRHHLWWEATLAVSAALVAALLGPWQGLERLVAAILGGLAVLSLAIALQYLARLVVAPALIHQEQENELALHTPRPRTSAPRGLIDFEVDVDENISGGRMVQLIQGLGDEARRMATEVGRLTPAIRSGNPPRTRLRAARTVARKMMSSARRIRRFHAKLVLAARDFEETWVGYLPAVSAAATLEQRRLFHETILRTRDSVVGYRDAISRNRLAFEGIKHLQQSVWIACELSDRVYANLEETLSGIAQAQGRILASVGSDFKPSGTLSSKRRRQRESKR